MNKTFDQKSKAFLRITIFSLGIVIMMLSITWFLTFEIPENLKENKFLILIHTIAFGIGFWFVIKFGTVLYYNVLFDER